MPCSLSPSQGMGPTGPGSSSPFRRGTGLAQTMGIRSSQEAVFLAMMPDQKAHYPCIVPISCCQQSGQATGIERTSVFDGTH